MHPSSLVSPAPRMRRKQAGLTLIELMVAMVIGLMITLATVAALSMSRAGFTAADSTSQLRENARFTSQLVQRLALQAGYEDIVTNIGTRDSNWTGLTVEGFNNALFNADASPAVFPPVVTNGSRGTGCGSVTDLSCQNGSDVLVLRFQGSSPPNAPTTPDGSVINCAGMPEALVNANGERHYSVLHVRRSTTGEPTLMCSHGRPGTANWVTQPLVQGIESFQVLFGVDTPANGLLTAADGRNLSLSDTYLRADQMTPALWRSVRSLRIGLVVRGAANSAVDRAASARSYFPLGPSFARAADAGSELVTTADGRVRLELATTIHLRNTQ